LATKDLILESKKLCITHNGPFHADDVLAGVLLKCAGLIGEYSEIQRTRDQQEMARADILFDVGGEYDPSKGRFDHHQRGRSGEVWLDGTPLSSAGLVWKAYESLISPDEKVRHALLKNWIIPIDADDNGCLPELPKNVRHVSALISDLNPRWDDTKANVDLEYVKACQIVEVLFLSTKNRAEGNKAAFDHVEKAVKAHVGSDLLILEAFCPWKSHLHDLETQYCPASPFKFVLFPQGSDWKIFQVPLEKGSRDGRAQFPEAWGGLREDQLVATSGITDAKFVHPGLFCGGAGSLEGAIAMARAAL
jgi:uncharacterized UPF0160 family protein